MTPLVQFMDALQKRPIAEPEVMLRQVLELARQWDLAAAALLARDYGRFDREMAKFKDMQRAIGAVG